MKKSTRLKEILGPIKNHTLSVRESDIKFLLELLDIEFVEFQKQIVGSTFALSGLGTCEPLYYLRDVKDAINYLVNGKPKIGQFLKTDYIVLLESKLQQLERDEKIEEINTFIVTTIII